MKEIKFKAWDKKDKEMIIPNDLMWRAEGVFIFSWVEYQLKKERGINEEEAYNNSRYLCEQNYDKVAIDTPEPRYVLLQYTGLKDKNSNDIYEGYILKKDDKTVYVKYDEENAKFVNIEIEISDNDDNVVDTSQPPKDIKEWEIIGNIYTNPELIKANNDTNGK